MEMEKVTIKKEFLAHEWLCRICDEYPTPFYLYDEQGIRARAGALREAFAWNPGFREFFAVKANPNPVILRILREEGCGADCSSLTELMLADAAGFKTTEIMFSSNNTPREDMELAVRLGGLINLDDISHIDFLDAIGGIPQTICCRFNPGNSFTIGNDIMSRPGDAKYGFTRLQLSEGFRELARRGAERFGLHAFLSSNTTDPEYYPALARLLFRNAVELRDETGCEIAFINLSGGVGIAYRPDEPTVDIRDVGEKIRIAYEEILVPAGMDGVAIFTELGRWLLGPCGVLVARAIHEKHIYKHYIGLDASAADLLRPAMYRAYHHITISGKENWPCDRRYDITGGLCENNDKFAVDRLLPEIRKGDLVVIHDAGAHGRAMGYNYNGKLRPAEILLDTGGKTKLIRRRETPADYFATLDVCGIKIENVTSFQPDI